MMLAIARHVIESFLLLRIHLHLVLYIKLIECGGMRRSIIIYHELKRWICDTSPYITTSCLPWLMALQYANEVWHCSD